MHKSEKFLYLLAGTGLGAIMGILFSPRAGHEIRNTLAEQAHRGVDRITEKVGEGRRYVQERGGASGTVRSMVDRGRQHVNSSIEIVKDRLNESIEAGRIEYRNRRGEGVL